MRSTRLLPSRARANEQGRSPDACDAAVGKTTVETARMQDLGEAFEATRDPNRGG